MTLLRMTLGLLCALGVGMLAPRPAAAEEAIKIGAVISVTGGAASLGDPSLKTLELYVDKINAAGGLLGRQIELIHYDDGSEPGRAHGLIKRLIQSDRVDMLIGGTTTGASMAMYPMVERAEIPFISLAGALVIVEPVKTWMFKISHHDRMVGEKVMTDMKQRGYTSIALLSDTSGFGQSAHKEMLEVAQRFGIDVVADETFNPKDTDVTAQLTKIKNTPGVQALFVISFGQGAVVATKNVAQLGLDLPHYETSGVASKDYIRLAGEASEGVLLPAPALMVASYLPDDDPQKQISLDYAAAWRERYGTDVSPFGAYTRDALFLWMDAVKRAGSVDKHAVRDALEATHGLAGTCGVVNMTPEDHLGLDLSAFKMVRIQDGDFVPAD